MVQKWTSVHRKNLRICWLMYGGGHQGTAGGEGICPLSYEQCVVSHVSGEVSIHLIKTTMLKKSFKYSSFENRRLNVHTKLALT